MSSPVYGRPAVERVLSGEVSRVRGALKEGAQGTDVSIPAGSMEREAAVQNLLAWKSRLYPHRHDSNKQQSLQRWPTDTRQETNVLLWSKLYPQTMKPSGRTRATLTTEVFLPDNTKPSAQPQKTHRRTRRNQHRATHTRVEERAARRLTSTFYNSS